VTPTIIDSSAWVDYLRGEPTAVARVSQSVREGAAGISGPIAAEILSGARSVGEYRLLRRLLEGLEWVPDGASLWERVAQHRFALARQGFRAGLIDLAIAITALDAGRKVLTRDRAFRRIRTVVPIELDLF
jgi:predicted nucleic acid-binding protein